MISRIFCGLLRKRGGDRMRRCRFACVGALLLALLLTGCGKAGTAPEDGGADFSETEQVETPEAADALTVKEIAR